MAVLDSTARADITDRFIRAYFVGLAKTSDLSSSEVRTLVNDLDAWLDANATSANTAITAAIRNKASSSTKFAALAWVAMKRSGVL
jgi:hypothetical protein